MEGNHPVPMRATGGSSPAAPKTIRHRCRDFARSVLLFIGLLLMILRPAEAAVSLAVPSFLMEGQGLRTNGGSFRLGAVAPSNVVVTLHSTSPEMVSVPGTVTVNAGLTNVLFDLTVGDDTSINSAQAVTITATAPGWGAATNRFQLWENDAHHVRFSPVGWLQTTNAGIGILLTAEDENGNRLTNFYGSVNLSATGMDGALALDLTNSGSFAGGQVYLSPVIKSLGKAVRLISSPIPGSSDAFNVGLPPFVKSDQMVADIAWHEPSKTLFASVPANGGAHSNRLVAIDPVTGLATNSYPLGGVDPGQIEVSPNANYLYVSLSNRFALQRFDINTRVAGLKFGFGSTPETTRFSQDFCVPSGMADSVVVSLYEQNALGSTAMVGFRRYDSATPAILPNFDANGGWMLEALPTGSEVILIPALARANAASGAILAVGSGDFRHAMKPIDGVIYDDGGSTYLASQLKFSGFYPGVLDQFYHTALPQVNSAARRVFYLAGYSNFGWSFYKLRIYDRDLYHPIVQLAVPGTAGAPSRFIRYGTNGLAYATGNGELWFIRPDLTQPDVTPADLRISVAPVTPSAVVGSDYHLNITLSNMGPGIVSLARVTNALPANATVKVINVPNGNVVITNSAFTWNVSELAAGSNAVLEVALRFGTAGWQTNSTWAVGFEIDPDAGYNAVTLPIHVELAPQQIGAFPVNAPSEDLIYDPARDRLLLSVGASATGLSNGIAIYDPHTGRMDSFVPLGKQPGRMVRSDNGQFLYVSLPADGLVRRLTLPNLVQDLEFELGGETINGTWYPSYASDLATVPGNPNALVVWRVRQSGPMAGEFGRGIAWFDNGVMRTNVTDVGGNWKVEFDSAGTLYAYNYDYNTGQLRPCVVDVGGVSFGEALPQFYSAGDDVEFAAGRLFSTAGRVIETQPFRITWVIPGAASGTLVEPDPAANRLYHFTQTDGWSIKVHELDRYRPLGSIPIPQLTGTPRTLIRWGTNGLAFRTSDQQLVVIRSPFVQPEAAAALTLNLNGPTVLNSIQEPALLTLTVTNAGPSNAIGLQITNRFFPAAIIDSVNTTTDSWATPPNQIVWSLSNLNAHAAATLTCTVRAGSTGTLTVVASAASSTPDLMPSDNTAFLAIAVASSGSDESASVLNLPVNDLAWSPTLGRLLATASNASPTWAGGFMSLNPFSRTVRLEQILGADATRLMKSPNDQRLYVGVDFGVHELSLPNLAAVDSFVINPSDPRARVQDLDVPPGANSALLVGSKSIDSNSSWLGIYDSGIPRTNIETFFSTGFSLEFGGDPELFYYQDHNQGGFRRYAAQTNGVTLLDSTTTLLPNATAITLSWADGSLFSSPGILIDPLTRTRLGQAPTITNNGAVCYDSAAGRAFHVSVIGTNAVVQAIDKATLLAVGSRTIGGMSGQAASLVRWETNGLAFRTTGGQLAILNTRLVPTAPATDLALTMTAAEPIGVVGSNFIYTVTVTNLGPNTAPNSQILFRVSTNASIKSVVASAGIVSTNAAHAVANLGDLASGGSATVLITVVPVLPGSLAAIASTTSEALESNSNDNSAALNTPAALMLAPGMTTIISQTANDLAYNATNGRLYVSGASGGISVINPALALVETNWAMPSMPTRLTLTDDAQYLYAAIDSGRRIGRVTTTNGMLDLNFSLGTNVSTSFVLVDFASMPGHPGTLAVSKNAGGFRRTEILDSGMARPGVQTTMVVNNVGFGSDPGVLYVTALRPYVIGETNLIASGFGIASLQNEDFEFADGHFYTTGGKRVEVPGRVITGSYAGLGTGTLVEPDVPSGRVLFLTRVGSAWQVRAYQPETYQFLGSTIVTNVLGTPTNFVRWGSDGLAFCTSSSQLFLMRSPLLPSGPSADIRLSQSTSDQPFVVRSNIAVTLTVTNAGPNTATNVLLVHRFPSNSILHSVIASQGSVTQSQGGVVVGVGTLTNGASAQIQVMLQPSSAGLFCSLAVVTSGAIDPALENNTTKVDLPVQFSLGPDSAGVVDLQTLDIEYNPASGLLYATPTNRLGMAGTVVTIDPVTGLIGSSVPVAPDISQLAITDDGTRLYALGAGGKQFHRLNLSSGMVELTVPIADATQNADAFATDIEQVPQQPESLAVVVQFPAISGGNPTAMIYDNAVRRPSMVGWQRSIEFYSPDLLMGYEPSRSTRMELTSTGLVERAYGHYLVDGDMVDGGGFIYTSGGSVIDPENLSKLRSFGITGPVAPDHGVNRVAFATGSGSGTTLRVFDTLGLLERGSLPITNVIGTPTKLIRCGADRYAFRTSGGQIVIVRSAGIPSGPSADLAIGLIKPTSSPVAGTPFHLTILVTNHGPEAASMIAVTNALPPLMSLAAHSASQGTITSAPSAILWHVGDLAAGAVATNQLTIVAGVGGFFSSQSIVYGSVKDTNAQNDVAETSWFVNPPAAGAVRSIKLSAGGIAWEPLTQRLLMSVRNHSPFASNSLLRLNPFTGQFDEPIQVGSDPGVIGVSDNGQFAYVGQDIGNKLLQVNLATGQVLTNNDLFGRLLEIELPPAVPNLVVTLQEGNPDAYLNGTELPLTGVLGWEGPTSITRPNASGRFYGYGGSQTFFRMTVNGTGWVVHDMFNDIVGGAETTIESAGGLVFSSSGTVLQPESLVVITNIPDLAANSLVSPDIASGHLSFLAPKAGHWWLRQYSHSTYGLLREIRVPAVSGVPKSLVRWGTNGLAFLTSSNQVHLLQPEMAYGDLAVSHQSWPTQVIAGQAFQVSLTLTNHGPFTCGDAWVTNFPSSFGRILSANPSRGSSIVTNNSAVFALGDVAPGETVSLGLTLIATNTVNATFTNISVASHAFVEMNPANNLSTISILARADRDLDAIPDDWEITYGLNPTNAVDAALDSDCDGKSNLEEFVAGRNPVVFEDIRLEDLRLGASGELHATLKAPPGNQFSIHSSTNLIHWNLITSGVIWTQQQTMLLAPGTATPAEFFRLESRGNSARPMVGLLTPPSGGQPAWLRIAAPPGRLFRLQTSTNLAQWITVSNYFASDCVTILPDPSTNNSPSRFYRILLP